MGVSLEMPKIWFEFSLGPMTILLRFACIGLLALPLSDVAVAGSPLEVRSVEARLFRHHTGSLSEPLTAKEALWNTIIGEGSAGEPSSSLLIDVIVAGTPGTFEESWLVELVVKNAKTAAVLSKQRKSVGVLSTTGVYHTGFWLPETGCEPLTVTARIRGGINSKEIKIPFACGE
jgi:hypothetical protein